MHSRKRKVLNQLLNCWWALVGFAPVYYHWHFSGLDGWFYLFLAISLLAALLPEKAYTYLAYSRRCSAYETLGVKIIRKFAQNGDFTAGIAGGRADDQRTVRSVGTARQYLRTVAMYERFHWTCFVFFLLSTVHAYTSGKYWTGTFIIVANVVFNVSTLLLQQYNKLRIHRLIVSRS